MGAEQILQLESVSVTFRAVEGSRTGPVHALREVDLSLREGELFVLLGPSGSGKSTLLRAIAGLEPLAAGRLLWAGQEITRMPVHRRGFALVFQDGQLFAHRSVAENVGYARRIAGAPRDRRQQRVAELLELVDLPGFGPRSVTDLSGGEQQRVALARALAAEPRLMLLDEPFAALDRQLRVRLAGQVRDILRAAGTTAMLVTHDQDEAFAVADRIGVVIEGRLVQVGTPEQLRRVPASAEIAAFLGHRP